MQLDPTAFNAFLANMAQHAQWRRSHACPCRNPRSGQADRACAQCHGLGTWWEDAVDTSVALSGQKVQQEWAKLGKWESGDQVVTLASDVPAYAMGLHDRLTMLDSTVPFSRVLRPGEPVRERVASLDKATWFTDGALFDVYPPPLVADDGTLEWPGQMPPDGAQIAISGRRHPEYFALQEFPQDRAHHGGRDLPRRVVLRAMDLFGRAAGG